MPVFIQENFLHNSVGGGVLQQGRRINLFLAVRMRENMSDLGILAGCREMSY